MLDYIRIACAVPPVQVGDPERNAALICDKIAQAEAQRADIVLFPELAITGYTCADLFMQESLLTAAKKALAKVTRFTKGCPDLLAAVGVPLVLDGQLYNCAAVLSGGVIRGITVKTFLPNHGEFYERRWFSSSTELERTEISARELGLEEDYAVPVGPLTYRLGDGTLVGVEICEDLWTPLPPSTLLALNGAQIILNLSASNESIAKREYRQSLVKQQSAGCSCVYAFCSAGAMESTQDLIFSGHSLIAENGKLLAESRDLIASDYLLVQDVDVGRIRADRLHNKSFRDCAAIHARAIQVRTVDCGLKAPRADGSLYPVSKLPFVPSNRADRQERCMAIFQMQVGGLKRRLAAINAKAVVGVSGGLDSTLALLVTAEAMRQLGRPMTDICGVTMPCFGTSDRTYNNSLELMRTLGVQIREVNIREAVMTHFRDIGHDPGRLDATYENAQARERTQVIMDIAGDLGGIVIGTGDLSELALGWCTYNGDHMSMYGVNASIPKTLIRWMVEAISQMPQYTASRSVLLDVLDTPISPELLPPDAEGKISQQTEDIVGPYALHDFFLYYMLRFGFTPEKIYRLACRAFEADFSAETVKKWLRIFYKRFFSQQFKRSCMPDGVKVGTVCLSPRGDWRMPSDITGAQWLREVDTL